MKENDDGEKELELDEGARIYLKQVAMDMVARGEEVTPDNVAVAMQRRSDRNRLIANAFLHDEEAKTAFASALYHRMRALPATPAGWNLRFVAYAKAHGKTPGELVAQDQAEGMASFTVWLSARWEEWRAMAGKGANEPLTDADHTAFDQWLCTAG